MGPRNLLILFFSTLAVSLVILIILFSLFFKNVDLNFETKLPDSAPDLEELYGDLPEAERADKAKIKVPEEYSTRTVSSSKDEDEDEMTEPVDRDAPDQTAHQGNQESSGRIEEPAEDTAPPTPPAPEKKPEPEAKPAAQEAPSSYQVYIGGFGSREGAQAKADAIGQGLVKGSGTNYIVQIGVFSNKANAESQAAQVGGSVRKLD